MCHLHWAKLSNAYFKNCEEFRRSANTSLEIYIVKKIGHTLCATTLHTSHIMHAHQSKQIIADNLRPIFFTNFFCEQAAQNGHLQCAFYSCWKSVNVCSWHKTGDGIQKLFYLIFEHIWYFIPLWRFIPTLYAILCWQKRFCALNRLHFVPGNFKLKIITILASPNHQKIEGKSWEIWVLRFGIVQCPLARS